MAYEFWIRTLIDGSDEICSIKPPQKFLDLGSFIHVIDASGMPTKEEIRTFLGLNFITDHYRKKEAKEAVMGWLQQLAAE